MKSKPKSIRFDEEKLEFAKTHLSKKSAQNVVDYLLDIVWWSNHPGYQAARLSHLSEGNFALTNEEIQKANEVIKNKVGEQVVEETEKKQAAKLPKDKKPKETPRVPPSSDPMPIKQEGEDALDFAVRKNEWKKRQNK